MAQNYISRGEVITIVAGEGKSYVSGTPYRINGFNGVALISVEEGERLSFQLEGIFELTLAGVSAGQLIYISALDALTTTPGGASLFGRAVTGSDANNKFYCRLLQS